MWVPALMATSLLSQGQGNSSGQGPSEGPFEGKRGLSLANSRLQGNLTAALGGSSFGKGEKTCPVLNLRPGPESGIT